MRPLKAESTHMQCEFYSGSFTSIDRDRVFFGPSWIALVSFPAIAMSNESLGAQGRSKLDIEEMPAEWEAHKCLRQYLQDGNVLFEQVFSENVKSVSQEHIHALLFPVLTKMSQVEGHPLPNVEDVREKVSALYKLTSQRVDESQVGHDAYMIKKCLSFVKMKVRIGKPSTVSYPLHRKAFWFYLCPAAL